tara:strand:+ start:1771 stop:1917 length:147 start_codon:yes stop_codon:yes gene_type:complete
MNRLWNSERAKAAVEAGRKEVVKYDTGALQQEVDAFSDDLISLQMRRE